MSRVVLDKVSKVYPNGFKAVVDLDLEIEDGEFLVLVGPSGCGKSTALRMIAGLEEISSGELRIGDRVLNDVEPKNRDIAMVFQNYALYPHMTVYQNIGFALKLAKVPKADADRRIREAARILELEDYLDRKPAQLSGGQRQRVAMGRAIVRNPQVFLFDEPLSNLDAKLRVQMRVEIKELHQRLKTTTVYVTHDQIEAMTMADKIVVMHDGIVEQIGAPLELYDRPNNLFVAGFIGSPAMNMIDGTISPSDPKTFLTADGTALPLVKSVDAAKGKPLVYGLRPEHVRFDPEGIPATVVVTEPTGAETLVIARLGGSDLTLVFHERIDVNPGDTLRIAINTSAVHVFDKETGQRL